MSAQDHHDKLARVCLADNPGMVLDRWRAHCFAALLGTLLGKGRDVTVIVGRRTDRKSGDFDVVLAEERS